MTLLKVDRLNKAYGSLHVTRDVSLDIAEGERHVIIGPNGAGKTSLINQLGGQVHPNSGRVTLAGFDITHLLPEDRLRHGLTRTFQKNTLFHGLSVFENVRLGITARFGKPFDLMRNVDGMADLNQLTWKVLTDTGLDSIADRRVAALSYGDQRQLEIAIALSGAPRLMLLDEPTSGLSPAETQQVIAFVNGLPRTVALIMIEHDMEVVFSIADRISVLHYGEIIATGLPDEVSSNQRVREVYLGADI